MNDNGEDAIAEDSGDRVIDGEWGYACVVGDAVFIPAVQATTDWPLRRVLARLHRETGHTRMIFAAVLNPESLKAHLRHIVREWDEWVPEMEDHSHCIEVAYQPSAREQGDNEPTPQPVDVRGSTD